ncbi:MAG: hypothetical protein WCD35_04635 [Mycobacteriales bacterium]
MRLARDPLRELASGVDSFYLSGRAALPQQLVDDLGAARELARESRVPVTLGLGECVDFRVQAGGFHRHTFRLDHPHGIVGVSASSHVPTFYVQIHAAFIHGVGVCEAIGWFTDLLEGLVGTVDWKTSRVDLFMDSQGWGLEAGDGPRFVCRPKQRITYEEDDVLTGFRLGSGKSGSALARIYDKTAESRLKGTDWWPLKWGEGFVPDERVLRVEFQVGRQVLNQVGVGNPADCLAKAPALWAYLTDSWLSYRVPTADLTRSRWPISPEWECVQAAALRGEALGLERVYAAQKAGSVRRLLPYVRGYLSSVGAHLATESLDDTLRRLGRLLAEDEEHTGVPFVARLQDKRAKLGLA